MEQTEEHTEEHVDEPADEPDEPTVDRNDRKERIGVVESAKMDKSITVSVRRQMKHPMYGKYLERSSTFMAHDEEDEAREGDTVRVMETRPISKNKRWRLVEVIERAK
ncbi:MAG: 30S ribosomal protein S17 [Bacteroidetes bacterium SW_8_64_56]|jgi:small subunit ribosomal protein S17|nr:MAG: 30S ribosomal protein S17 [Bacteroidetes bacterium QS_4_64_154]PSR03562.1 MAG: 30S ribosomal protein S17 [Bacteroidetes bacterium SW_8_64_56]